MWSGKGNTDKLEGYHGDRLSVGIVTAMETFTRNMLEG
jgi:hypothetical protein